MMEQALLWLKFLTASGLVVVAGLSLTRNAERLAEAFGWGHAFAGFMILGCATSLPELTISLSAVTAVGSPTLSTGNITGSVIFNLGILALLDLLARRRTVRDGGQVAGLAPLGLFNLALLGGMTAISFRPQLFAGNLAAFPAGLLLAGYLGATFQGWWTERRGGADGAAPSALPHPADVLPGEQPGPVGTAAALLRCLVAAVVILSAGIWLSHLGDQVAQVYGRSQGFVGRLFLAVTSSLPELVTGLAAVRLGLHVMAAGSILGSNVFNLGILGACDLVYQAGAPTGLHLLLAAHQTEPFAAAWSWMAALSMTLLLLVARWWQHRGGGSHPPALTAWAALVLYVFALVEV